MEDPDVELEDVERRVKRKGHGGRGRAGREPGGGFIMWAWRKWCGVGGLGEGGSDEGTWSEDCRGGRAGEKGASRTGTYRKRIGEGLPGVGI